MQRAQGAQDRRKGLDSALRARALRPARSRHPGRFRGLTMPTRLIDYEAMWASDKLAACTLWARREFPWLYGLADAHGSFEMTNMRVIYGKVAAIREDLSPERLQEIVDE